VEFPCHRPPGPHPITEHHAGRADVTGQLRRRPRPGQAAGRGPWSTRVPGQAVADGSVVVAGQFQDSLAGNGALLETRPAITDSTGQSGRPRKPRTLRAAGRDSPGQARHRSTGQELSAKVTKVSRPDEPHAAFGGLWLWNTRFPSGLVIVVVPSALSRMVQPQVWTQARTRSRSQRKPSVEIRCASDARDLAPMACCLHLHS